MAGDAKFRRLGEYSESMLARWRAGEQDEALAIWEMLSSDEKRLIATGWIALINEYRSQLFPPGSTFGPGSIPPSGER